MAKIVLTLESPKAQNQMESQLELRTKEDRYGIAQDLATLIRGAMTGAEPLSMSFVFSDATATLTNQAITYTAKQAGTQGNAITIALIDPPGNNVPLSIAVVGNAITATLATDGSSAITTTATQLVAALNASAAALALVSVTGSGATALTAVAATALASGTDQTKVLKFNVA